MELGIERLLLFFVLVIGTHPAKVPEPRASNKVVTCYWESWAVYRMGDGQSTLSTIDPMLCTHLIYTFAGFATDNVTIAAMDPWCDLLVCGSGGMNNYQNAVNLRKKNPNLKVLIAIGGWNEGSARFSNMSSSAYTRQKFIASVVRFLLGYDFDGLDIDWEYPTDRGGVPEDKEYFTLLLQELRAAFDGVVRDPERGNLILTAAIPASAERLETSFDLPKIAQAVDYLHVMTYDYHTFADGAYLYHHSGMDSFPSESPGNRTRNVKYTIEFLLNNGVPANKIVLGIAAYGHTFLTASPNAFHIFDDAKGPGLPGPYTQSEGTMAYYEICTLLAQGGFNTEWNETVVAPYSYNGTTWIAYDDYDSVVTKASYVIEQGLAGALVWAISEDDCKDICGLGKCPITTTINLVFQYGR